MVKQPNKSKLSQAKRDLAVDDQSLKKIAISDEDLISEDKKAKVARKQARKTAKAHRTPLEVKRSRLKKLAIAGAALLVCLGVIFGIPKSRWAVLNAVGLRGDLVLHLIQTDTKRPITNAVFKLDDGQYGLTDSAGQVRFNETRLGVRMVTVQKDGYARLSLAISNHLGTTRPAPIKLKAIGIKLEVEVDDWLSGQAIVGAKVQSGKYTAQTDKDGQADLIVAPTDQDDIPITIHADGYLDKNLTTATNVAKREVDLVSVQKDYFISKRDGKLDIFSANLDGSNQQKIIAGTGSEDESTLQFSVNRANKQAILVATRDGKQLNNRLVAGIYVVDLEKAKLTKVDEGSDVQLLDWANDTLYYSKTIPDLHYDDPALTRLMSYNLANSKLVQQAQANYFSTNIVAQNKLFYMPANAYQPIEGTSFTSIDSVNGAQKNYLDNLGINYSVRDSYGTIKLQSSDGRIYQLQIANGSTKEVTGLLGTNLKVVLSPTGSQAAWTDRRDGQGALVVRSIKEGTERVVVKAGGITSPIRFLSDNLIVARVVTSQETADYIVDITSGKMAKIVDVSNVGLAPVDGL